MEPPLLCQWQTSKTNNYIKSIFGNDAQHLLEITASPSIMSFLQDPFHVGLQYTERSEVIDKFGKNMDVDTEYDVISLGGSPELLSVPETFTIVSDDPNDSITGTGAQKILLQFLDEKYRPVEKEIELSGSVPVTTDSPYLRFLRGKITQVGSDRACTNLGKITIAASTNTSVITHILPLEGQTQTAQYTIPAKFTGFLQHCFISASTSNSASITAQLQVRPFGEGWQTKHEATINIGRDTIDMSGSGAIPQKSDIRWIAKGKRSNNVVTAGYKVVLRPN